MRYQSRILTLLVYVIAFVPLSLCAQEELKTWASEGLRDRVKRVTSYSLQWPEQRESSAWRGLTLDFRTDFDSLGRVTGYAVSDPQESDTYETYRYDSLGRVTTVTEHWVRITGDSVHVASSREFDMPDEPDSGSYSYVDVSDASGRVVERICMDGDGITVFRRTRYTYGRDGLIVADSTWGGVGGLLGFTAYTYSGPILRRREKYTVFNNSSMLSTLDEFDSNGTLIRNTWYGCCSSPWFRQTTFRDGRAETEIEQVESFRKEGRYEYQDDEHGNWIRRRYFHRESGSKDWLLFLEQRRVITYW